MLGDKYIAGFLDADGCVEVMWRKPTRGYTGPDARMYLSLNFTQMTQQDEVIHRIHESIGGSLYHYERSFGGVTTLKMNHTDTVKTLNRIRKYIVIKRHYVDVCLEKAGEVYNKAETSAYLKEQRRVRSLPLPKHPTRQWLAGYFDGDGAILVRKPKSRMSAQPVLQIACSDFDSEGVEIIHKAFGGSIQQPPKKPQLRVWVCALPPSKAIQVFGYFGKHLVVKRDQADFILGCAAMGHYRDGESIKAALKQLKAHPHRLNGTSPAKDLLATVRDIDNEMLSESRRTRMAYARSMKA